MDDDYRTKLVEIADSLARHGNQHTHVDAKKFVREFRVYYRHMAASVEMVNPSLMGADVAIARTDKELDDLK